MRETYIEYVQRLFQRAKEIDLSAESVFLKEDARTVMHRHGGKHFGLKLLEQLLYDSKHPNIGIPSSLVIHADYLGDHIDLPADFVKEDMDTDQCIFRSNASFEYGSPPGFLKSVGMVPVASIQNQKLPFDMMKKNFLGVKKQYGLDDDVLHILIQPQLFPRASGIIYTSFDARPDDPVIIEASLGSCLSATVGLPNLVHYRVHPNSIEVYRNFGSRYPTTLFTGRECRIDFIEGDISRRELNTYRQVSNQITFVSEETIKQIWEEKTFPVGAETCSPLRENELRSLYAFGKYAESRLGKPLKIEFAFMETGKLYLLQLDPAMLEVSDQLVPLHEKEGSIKFRTPFVNMPVTLEGLDVVVEAVNSFGLRAPQEPFIFIPETIPMNMNIEYDLAPGYPQCQAIVSPVGSRMNHCYSEARTYIPYLGVVGFFEAITERFGKLKWGHNKGIKMDVHSDGRWAQVQVYKVR